MTTKITFNKNFTIATVSKDFKEKMFVFGTEEYETMQKIKSQFPHISFRVASSYVQKTAKFTYKRMRDHLSTLDNADQRLAEMDRIQKQSQIYHNPYRYVLTWFKNVCPDLFVEDEDEAKIA